MAETLAAHIAERVRERQGGLRAEVTIARPLPGAQADAGVRHEDAGALHADRHRGLVRARASRRLVGVQAQGMTACPCAQELVAGSARERLLEPRASPTTRSSASSRPFRSRPTTSAASARCYVGCPEGCDVELDAETLLAIVEDSMSSEIFELMKRSDERAVVEKAHRRPRFVEDCVREMIKRRRRVAPGSTTTRSCSRARRTSRRSTSTTSSPSATGSLGELRAELDSATHSRRHVTMREWLESPRLAPQAR